MTRVVGLDPSLTATGLASITTIGGPAPDVRVATVTSTGHRGDTLYERDTRIRRLITDVDVEIWHMGPRPALVVIEGPAFLSHSAGNWDRAGLWWRLVANLAELDVPVAVGPPTVVKKFASGKGNADKTAVAAGMTRLWSEVHPSNDNEFDALALATMGAQRLGLPVPSRSHHAETLTRVEWPS